MVIRLVDPTFTPAVMPFVPPERPRSLAGKVVGLLGNGKPNSPVFLAFLGELLRERYGAAEVRVYQKEFTTKSAPPDLLDEVARNSDLVVTGVGD